MSAIVVRRNLPHVVAGYASGLWGGQVLRDDFAEMVGLDKLDRMCIRIPLIDIAGFILKGFSFYKERVPRGEWRGSSASKIELCMVCKRLLYWPVPRPYLLERYWDGGDGAAIICGEVVAADCFTEQVIKMPQFAGLEREERPCIQQAIDGLPDDFQELIAALDSEGVTGDMNGDADR